MLDGTPAREGESEGIAEGESEGIAEGESEGITEGESDGIAEGESDGITEGESDGITEGESDGITGVGVSGTSDSVAWDNRAVGVEDAPCSLVGNEDGIEDGRSERIPDMEGF